MSSSISTLSVQIASGLPPALAGLTTLSLIGGILVVFGVIGFIVNTARNGLNMSSYWLLIFALVGVGMIALDSLT